MVPPQADFAIGRAAVEVFSGEEEREDGEGVGFEGGGAVVVGGGGGWLLGRLG